MTRNLKALGLALVAMFAMGAIASSAAQASLNPLTVTPEKYPAVLTIDALGEQVYTTSSGQVVKCKKVFGHATIKEPGVGDTNVTFTDIRYEECSATGNLPVTVDMTGCHYLFHGGEVTEPDPTHFWKGTVDLECPAGVTGPDVKIYSNAANHAAGTVLCTLTVSAFKTSERSGEVTYTNTPTTSGPPHVPNDFDVKAIEVNTPVKRDGSILCGSPTSANYNGEVTVTGYEDLGTNGSGTPIEGNRIGVTISEPL